ncbi:MAG: zinc-ribbon domain-containing protein [Ruminococcus sp.]|nr:zinc-ribbon domain-containing protein [Ruminococcus sp.]
MYCNRCNAYNDDNARFCNNCGAELAPPTSQPEQPFDGQVPPNQEQPFNGNVPPQGNFNGTFNNNSPYGQPMYRSQPSKYTNTMPIIAIVASILNFNILGIIFAILSLVNYNNHETAMRMGDFAKSEMYGRKSKTYSIASIVISIVLIAVRFILGIVWFFFAGEMFTSIWPEFFNEFYYDEYPMMINVISMIQSLI